MNKYYLDFFSKKETIVRLLNEVELNNYDYKKIERTYTIGEDRLGFISQMIDKVSGCLCRIIIDFKHGLPTSQQFYDLTYDLGNDCDHKIVLFDSAKIDADRSDPSAFEFLNQNFAEILRSYGESAHLIYTRPTASPDGRIDFEFCSRHGSRRYPKLRNRKLPSKWKFKQAEFWEFYHDNIPYDYICYEFRPKPGMYPYNEAFGLKISPSWTDKGLFMNISTNTEYELLQWLIMEKRKDLKKYANQCFAKHFSGFDRGDSQVTGERDKSGNVKKISVLMAKLSFKEVVYSSPKEKMRLAGMVLYMQPDFFRIIKELIDSRKVRKKSKKK